MIWSTLTSHDSSRSGARVEGGPLEILGHGHGKAWDGDVVVDVNDLHLLVWAHFLNQLRQI